MDAAITSKEADIHFDTAQNAFICAGEWTIHHVQRIPSTIDTSLVSQSKPITFDGSAIERMDSAGALALNGILDTLTLQKRTFILHDFMEAHTELVELVKDKKSFRQYKPTPPQKHNVLYQVGEETVRKLDQADGLIILIGNLSEKLVGAFGNWKRFQVPSIIANINLAGVQALPILAMLSFLIGVVLAYQMGLQLENYGANSLIAFLSGMASFREFAPLITAIIVAGRTSSAFTAQIGNMKISEEVDAIETMGLSATELLVIPKVLGLLLVFPLLNIWSDIFSILGAMIMSKMMLDVGYYDFINRVNETVGAKQMLLGLYKAPVFAVLIALVGSFQGFQVEANAGSLGIHTTKSVVQALFLIIVADAVFSIVYSWLGL